LRAFCAKARRHAAENISEIAVCKTTPIIINVVTAQHIDGSRAHSDASARAAAKQAA